MLKKIMAILVSIVLISTLALMIFGIVNPYVFWIVAIISALIAFVIIPKLMD